MAFHMIARRALHAPLHVRHLYYLQSRNLASRKACKIISLGGGGGPFIAALGVIQTSLLQVGTDGGLEEDRS